MSTPQLATNNRKPLIHCHVKIKMEQLTIQYPEFYESTADAHKDASRIAGPAPSVITIKALPTKGQPCLQSTK